MKQGFDKLEAFRCSLNALVKLYCNISDAYDKRKAEEVLQSLVKQWHRDENYVIMAITQKAQTTVDARLRYMVQQVVEKLQLPITQEEFRKKWENLSNEEKMELVDSTISFLQEIKKEG